MNEKQGSYVSLGSQIEAEFGSGRAMPAEEDWNKRVREKMDAHAAMAGRQIKSAAQDRPGKQTIGDELSHLRREIDCLHEVLQALSDRLGPILTPQLSDTACEDESINASASELALLIRKEGEKIALARNYIGGILNRLEI